MYVGTGFKAVCMKGKKCVDNIEVRGGGTFYTD